MDKEQKPTYHTVHFAVDTQQVFIPNDSQLIPEASVGKGCFSYVADLLYNAAEDTILGKTKEKWLFIFLGLLVVSLFIFLVVSLIQQTVEASVSEFTYTKRDDTGEYYVIKRKLDGV